MPFSVPLQLQIVDAVIYRLDFIGTRALDPPGAAVSGYSDAFREPVVYDAVGGSSVSDRQSSRVELSPIRVPCQVETSLFNSLEQSFQGNLEQSEMALVFHRSDLRLLNLINETTGDVQIGIGDRVAALEQHNSAGVIALQLSGKEGLFVKQIMPRSWGFGSTGFDLHVVIIGSRDQGTM